jgi:hypothetical protein
MPTPSLGLFQVDNPLDKAFGGMSQAANTFASMEKRPYKPPLTVGGGMMSAVGGASAGASIGAQIGSAGGPIGALGGAGIGAALGGLAYYLSR